MYLALVVQLIAVPVAWLEQYPIVAVVDTMAVAVVASVEPVLVLVLLALPLDQAAQQLAHVLVIDATALPWPLESELVQLQILVLAVLQPVLLEQLALGLVEQLAVAQ